MGNAAPGAPCSNACMDPNGKPLLIFDGKLEEYAGMTYDGEVRIGPEFEDGRRWATNTQYMQQCTSLSSNRRKATVTAACPKDVHAVLLADAVSPSEDGLYAEFKFFAPFVKDDASVETAETDEDAFCRVSIGFTPADNPFDEVWGFGPKTIYLGKQSAPLANFEGLPWTVSSTAVYLPSHRKFMCLFVENRLIAKTIFPKEIEDQMSTEKKMKVFCSMELCPLQSSVVLSKRVAIPAASEVFAMLEDEINHTAKLCGIKEGADSETDLNEFRAPEIVPLTEEALAKSWTCRICDLRNPNTAKMCMECNRVPMDHVFRNFKMSKSKDLPRVKKGGYANFLDDIAPLKTPRVAPKSEGSYNIVATRKRSSVSGCSRQCTWGPSLDQCF